MHSTDNGLTSSNNVTKRDGTGLIGQGPPLEVNVEVIDGNYIENFRPGESYPGTTIEDTGESDYSSGLSRSVNEAYSQICNVATSIDR